MGWWLVWIGWVGCMYFSRRGGSWEPEMEDMDGEGAWWLLDD